MNPVSAKFAGICPACEKPYPEGAMIAIVVKGQKIKWGHDSCQPKQGKLIDQPDAEQPDAE